MDDFVINETKPPPKPERIVRGMPVDAARELLADHLRAIMAQVLRWHGTEIQFMEWNLGHPSPPHIAVRSTTGTGKSDIGRNELVRLVKAAKAAELPHRIIIAVPTHDLADEANFKMPRGVTTMIWQGRRAKQLGTKEPMCKNLDAVKAAEELGLTVQKAACKHDDMRCPLFETCAYQRQKALARKADIIFCAHEILFQLPDAFGNGFALIVIDEGFWQDGLNIDGELVIESLNEELDTFPVRHRKGMKRKDDTTHLTDLIGRLQQALAQMPVGYVQRQPLIDAGLLPTTQDEPSSCHTAYRLEWDRKHVRHGVYPGAAPEQLEEMITRFGFLGRVSRRAAMWRILGELIDNTSTTATGRLRIEIDPTNDGPVRKLRLLRAKEVADKLADLPILHLDATLQLELSRHFLPDLELTLDLVAATPNMKVTQVIGLPVGKSSLEPKSGNRKRKGKTKGAWTETPEEAEARVARKRQNLADTAHHLIRGRTGLVITYKGIEKDFKGVDGTEVAHFGDIEGIDRWIYRQSGTPESRTVR